MSVAHVCHICGTDLSRCRGAVHPDFALPVVRCPACETTIVRRLVPHRMPGKWTRRACSTSFVLLRNTLLLGIITAAHLFGSYRLAESDSEHIIDAFSVSRLDVIFPILIFPVFAGITLFSCFGHIRTTWLLAGWWIYGALWLVAIQLPEIMNEIFYGVTAGRTQRLRIDIQETVGLILASVFMFGIELLGAVPGVILARATARGRRVRRAKRRRRSRMNRGRTA